MRETLTYDFVATPLGECLLARSDAGICHLEFTDDDEVAALATLAERWPQALLQQRAERELSTDPFAGGPAPPRLDLRGTQFQLEVWQALREIPPGVTLTYGELARSLGRPGSARAVASAVASNRIAGLVPCHRVVAAGGGLGGFRWGPARKARWLSLEASLAA